MKNTKYEFKVGDYVIIKTIVWKNMSIKNGRVKDTIGDSDPKIYIVEVDVKIEENDSLQKRDIVCHYNQLSLDIQILRNEKLKKIIDEA